MKKSRSTAKKKTLQYPCRLQVTLDREHFTRAEMAREREVLINLFGPSIFKRSFVSLAWDFPNKTKMREVIKDIQNMDDTRLLLYWKEMKGALHLWQKI